MENIMELQCIAANYLSQIKSLLGDEKRKKESSLPDGCFFLDENTVLCAPRNNGDARYPYTANGFNLWAYSSGYITINESTFYVVLPSDEGKEPYLNFYAGEQTQDGYKPVSLLGIGASPLEGNVSRYTIYTPQAVYYLTQTKQAYYCVRAFVEPNKRVHFSISATNTTNKTLNTYLSAYFNCFLMHGAAESVETKWFKQCKTNENGFTFYSVEDISRTEHLHNYGVITRGLYGGDITKIASTTSRDDYVGGRNNYLAAAKPLFTGAFELNKPSTKFTQTAVAGDLITYSIKPNESARLDYCLTVANNENDAIKMSMELHSLVQVESALDSQIAADSIKFSAPSMLKMNFSSGHNDKISAPILQNFLKFVMRQVEFAALSKNSGVSLLGVRDVFQQLEAALMWNPTDCRAKILEGIGFIGENGRPPRQYSIPATPDSVPPMDLRMFIDQGVWIINTVYAYLSYTGDYSILDEICGYYRLDGGVAKSSEKDSCLQHLIRIMRFLIDNLDEKTGCLHVLYGDWNDALDGMGVSLDSSKPFGTGVSVMASLQLYENISQMKDILRIANAPDSLQLDNTANRLKNGLQKYAIQNNDEERRILHGWGDERLYLVGSREDSDGKDRVGLTSNAFWVLSKAYEWDKSIKQDILRAYKRLDSKYGLKTFEPYFAPGAKGVGRIVNLPKGTAENSATYAHATLFGIWSLFEMGESKLAWQQMEKILPITHEHISTTQFIMSNSYSLNDEFGMDGESMSDWYTGSANVLIKLLVRSMFGLEAKIDGLHVHTCSYMPFDKAQIRIRVREAIVTLNYENTNSGTRIYKLTPNNSNETEDGLFIPAKDLKDNIEISVID